MTIGIDISQLAYENTGVSNYLKNLVETLTKIDKKNKYILFYSSLRRKLPDLDLAKNTEIKTFKYPPIVLDFIWNKIHKLPIENFIGNVDIFITSDWTEPPTKKAKKATILYDLIVFKYPQETAGKIIDVQKRKLKWAKKENSKFLCISQSSKKDAIEILNIEKEKLEVIYPGL